MPNAVNIDKINFSSPNEREETLVFLFDILSPLNGIIMLFDQYLPS